MESIYPFKINQVRIANMIVTYIDEAKPERPLHLTNGCLCDQYPQCSVR